MKFLLNHSQVVLVDTFPEDSSPIPDLVDQYIQYDSSDHTKDDEHADKIIEILEQQDIGIDGCCTFWEDCGPLAAIINEKLDLCGAGVK